MREIVFDTETTGTDFKDDRVIEIGCVELHNHLPTGRTHWVYCNPEMPMPEEAFRIHGLSDEFLADKPKFSQIADAFLDFIGDAVLIAHNAEFDVNFINAELRRLGRGPLKNTAVDTMQLARKRFPGAVASLDALCRRFGVDNSDRSFHGALLDSQLLAEVYLELKGGRQRSLGLSGNAKDDLAAKADQAPRQRRYREPRPHAPAAEERAAHRAMLELLNEPIWNRIDAAETGS